MPHSARLQTPAELSYRLGGFTLDVHSGTGETIERGDLESPVRQGQTQHIQIEGEVIPAIERPDVKTTFTSYELRFHPIINLAVYRNCLSDAEIPAFDAHLDVLEQQLTHTVKHIIDGYWQDQAAASNQHPAPNYDVTYTLLNAPTVETKELLPPHLSIRLPHTMRVDSFQHSWHDFERRPLDHAGAKEALDAGLKAALPELKAISTEFMHQLDPVRLHQMINDSGAEIPKHGLPPAPKEKTSATRWSHIRTGVGGALIGTGSLLGFQQLTTPPTMHFVEPDPEMKSSLRDKPTFREVGLESTDAQTRYADWIEASRQLAKKDTLGK